MNKITRRSALSAGLALTVAAALPRPGAAQASPSLDQALLAEAVERARSFEQLHGLIVAQNGVVAFEEAFRGPSLERAVNVKSLSKTLLSAITGAAIEARALEGPDQPIAPVLGDLIPADADAQVNEITVGHLLSMRAGLERTSGRNYGAWVTSGNWLRYALSRPFVDEPGGRMLYSTGSSHILSAVLTRATGRSTLDLAREWLGEPLGVEVPAWQRSPEGFYFGGNNMQFSPRGLLRLGEAYRTGGALKGQRVVPAAWVETSWIPRARSPFTGHAYGYGWFLTEAAGHPVRYGWGYGGQMLYVVPSLDLTVVITSDPNAPSGRTGYARQLHRLMAEGFIPAATV